jgi:hypothetical protein
MNLDELKTGWRDAHDRLASDSALTVPEAIRATARRFETSIARRDIVETVCAIAVIAFFGWALWGGLPAGMFGISILLMMVSVAWAAGVLLWSRRRDKRPDRGVPVAAFATAELARIDRQIRLLRRVTWWYSLPVLGSAGLFLWSLARIEPSMPWTTSLLFMAGFGLCLVWAASAIHRSNRAAIRKELIPLRERLLELLGSLKDQA